MAVTIQQIAEQAGVSRGTVDGSIRRWQRESAVWRTRWDMYRKNGNIPEQLKMKD
mgnify:CR=1 FL=1